MWRLFAVALLLVVLPATASAQDAPGYVGTIQDLRSDCVVVDTLSRTAQTPDLLRAASCIAFLSGIYALGRQVCILAQVLEAAGEDLAFKFMKGSAVSDKGDFTGGQLVQIFLDWSNRNPTRWQEVALSGAQSALSEAAPCEAAGPGN